MLGTPHDTKLSNLSLFNYVVLLLHQHPQLPQMEAEKGVKTS